MAENLRNTKTAPAATINPTTTTIAAVSKSSPNAGLLIAWGMA
jgi:hypothetical protein